MSRFVYVFNVFFLILNAWNRHFMSFDTRCPADNTLTARSRPTCDYQTSVMSLLLLSSNQTAPRMYRGKEISRGK